MKVSLSQIKSWFKKGLYPTESQFSNTWDSFWHKDDKLSLNSIEGLIEVLNKKANSALLDAKANKEHLHVLDDIVNIDEFKVDVDAFLSQSSENPVQNKVVNAALNEVRSMCEEKFKSYTIELASGADIAQDVNLQGNITIKKIVGYNVNSIQYVVVGLNTFPVRLTMTQQESNVYVWEGELPVENGKIIVWTAGKVNSGTAAFGVLYE
jgi:hypothetical protein